MRITRIHLNVYNTSILVIGSCSLCNESSVSRNSFLVRVVTCSCFELKKAEIAKENISNRTNTNNMMPIKLVSVSFQIVSRWFFYYLKLPQYSKEWK